MKKNILINDGISSAGEKKLIDYKFNIFNQHIEQKELINFINQNNISVLLVRSVTKVRKNIIDSCTSLKIIGRGGVGMDNIDVEYAQKKGIHVINTPNASSSSVAELVFAHLFSMARYTYHSNRTMPLEGDTNFKELKKQYSKGIELRNKTIGIIGFGKIGQEVAKIGLGLGMSITFYDPYITEKTIKINIANQSIKIKLEKLELTKLFIQSDIITIHVPKQKNPLITNKEFQKMKKGVFIINTSRGGIINEKDLINNLNNKHVQSAGLDVYEDEPNPKIEVLMHNNIALSPHIGASTIEAQKRIGLELAEQINQIFNG